MDHRWIRFLVALMAMLASPACQRDELDYRASTFQRLETARREKKDILVAELRRLWDTAARAGRDETLLKAFRALRPTSETPAGSPRTRDVTVHSLALDEHYVGHYGEFYDILLVDETGFVFHTIKMESDYHQNLFSGPLAGTRLSGTLREKNEAGVRFVDYDYYHPSREAASFFVTAVAEAGRPVGWIVFQFSINAVNEVLEDHAGLGTTGEVYLTNGEKMMISQSRLVAEDTVLRLKVDTEALRTALEKRSGNLLGRDYRNVAVFSSFERFSFAGSDWIIVAEMDEDEVITEHFAPRLEKELPRLLALLTPGEARPGDASPLPRSPAVRVDINEYARIAREDAAATFGVATCTAVVVRHRDRFAYLGHVYPLDATYRSALERGLRALGIDFSRRRAAGTGDLLDRMLRRLKHHDIHPHEIRDLDVALVAVHSESLVAMVRKLVAEGFFLSQIHVLHHPAGRYANVAVESGSADIAVEWVGRDGTSSRTELSGRSGKNVPDLGLLLGRNPK